MALVKSYKEEIVPVTAVLTSNAVAKRKEEDIVLNWVSTIKKRPVEFAMNYFSRSITRKRIGSIALATIIVGSTIIEAGCTPKPLNAESQLTTNATQVFKANPEFSQEKLDNSGIIEEIPEDDIDNDPATKIDATPYSKSEPVATEKLESLKKDFGLGDEDFPLSGGETVHNLLIMTAERYKDYPYHYVVYPSIGEPVFFSWSKAYKPEKVGETFLEQFPGNVQGINEQKIFEKVMGSSSYSNIVDGFYQTVILVSEETGEDGITRNGFFSYSESGIAIYIDINGFIHIYKGNNIDVDVPEVRDLFNQGYTQVRIVNGKAKGFFNINDLQK
ncbi:MAG: hypothetical protein PWQ55_734 [Chloroflexota bacterium]|nr:hypothetical protein [Chloroflexota bacterium]